MSGQQQGGGVWQQITLAEKIWLVMMAFLAFCCLAALVPIIYFGGLWVASMDGWDSGPWVARFTVIAVTAVVYGAITLHHHVTRKPPVQERDST